MNKKCINCKHLKKGRYYTHCELVPQDRIEKKQMYQFVKCNTFREKDYTGIPDSLWKLPIQVKSIKKKIRDLTFGEVVELHKKHYEKYEKHCCDKDCPIFKVGTNFCFAYTRDSSILEKEVEVDE